MKMVIFVGGPTACGKSTFVNSLSQRICNSIQYRRYQGFFDIANQKDIPKNKIFNSITSSEVDNWFVGICKNSDTVISDVHYAIQMNRSNLNVDIYQNYVPTISVELIKKLLLENIQIVAVFLSCASRECLNRSVDRYNKNGKEVRNVSIEDAMIESQAEEREWNNILSTGMVDGLKLNSEQFSVEQLTNQCLEYLKKYEEKTLEKIKKC